MQLLVEENFWPLPQQFVFRSDDGNYCCREASGHFRRHLSHVALWLVRWSGIFPALDGEEELELLDGERRKRGAIQRFCKQNFEGYIGSPDFFLQKWPKLAETFQDNLDGPKWSENLVS